MNSLQMELRKKERMLRAHPAVRKEQERIQFVVFTAVRNLHGQRGSEARNQQQQVASVHSSTYYTAVNPRTYHSSSLSLKKQDMRFSQRLRKVAAK